MFKRGREIPNDFPKPVKKKKGVSTGKSVGKFMEQKDNTLPYKKRNKLDLSKVDLKKYGKR